MVSGFRKGLSGTGRRFSERDREKQRKRGRERERKKEVGG